MATDNKDLLGRKIDFMFSGEVINTFMFTKIKSIGKQMNPYLNRSVETYLCDLMWTKEMEGADKKQVFYYDIFDDLRKTGVAVCPFMPSMMYAFKE